MIYETQIGEHVSTTAKGMCNLAKVHNTTVTATFNGIELVATPNSTPGDVEQYFHAECNRRAEEYRASPEYRAEQERAALEDMARSLASVDLLSSAPKTMTLRNAEFWNALVKNNTDPYGAAVVSYAETWARMMEARMSQGSTLEDCAKQTSHLADAEGITGAMYGFAVAALAKVWIHGEALRKWHNKDYGRPDAEGTINPAILTIGG